MRLTQSAVLHALTTELGVSRRRARRLLSAFTAAITAALASGQAVRLREFGSFAPVAGRPRSGSTAPRVRFRGARRLRDAMRAEESRPDPALALLCRHIESADGIAVMLERHRRWCENPAGDRPDLAHLNLEGVDLFGARLRAARLSGAGMSRADLGEADLCGADLARADLTGASLAWADLKGANLKGACLRGADMRWADLRHADLSDADLAGANLRAALLDGARLDPPPAPAGRPVASRRTDRWRPWRALRLF